MKNLFQFLTGKRFLINAAIALVLLPLLIWATFAWMSSFTNHGDFIEVPDFIDLKISQLDRFVDDKPVKYEIIDSIWDPQKQKGVVFRQDPEPKAHVKENRTVYLYVTAITPPSIAMPKLEDLSQRQAKAVCESYGLKAEFKEVEDPHHGAIIEQRYKGKRIEPGTPIMKGETVLLMVGVDGEGGISGMPIPNLNGLTFRQARGKLLDMGLDWLLIQDPDVKDSLNAFVYNQNPVPGKDKKIIKGTTIDIFVTSDKSKLKTED
ncbi:MAG: PASTA domain-containing protein [Bacteroidetes bacterium]|jgi:beta-lactam-binding protein with PASTA domain|nr:PASTA domain-containing protein [Bacteroidota bacterium]